MAHEQQKNQIPYLVLELWGPDEWGDSKTLGLLFVRMDRYRRARLADWADSLRFLWRMLPEPEEIQEITFNCPATPVFSTPRYDDPEFEITFDDIGNVGAIFTAAGEVEVEDILQDVRAQELFLRVDVSPELAQLLEARHGTWEAHTSGSPDKGDTSFIWTVYESEEGFQRMDSAPITEARVQELFGEHPPTERGVKWRPQPRSPETTGRVTLPREVSPAASEGPDIIVQDEVSIFMVKPVSDAGRQWINDHIPTEPWQWVGEALAVEHRYIKDVIDGMLEDGLIVEFEEFS